MVAGVIPWNINVVAAIDKRNRYLIEIGSDIIASGCGSEQF
jgi:hypothetical protein